jgi:hypothetical protein
MADPTPDPASRKRSISRDRLIDAGLEAASLSMMAFIAVGLLVYGGRREISRELAQSWLRERGIDAVVTVDELDASGFSGSVLLGPKSDPIFAADRIEVAYDLQAPWSGGPFAIDTRAVRLVRPRLKASLTDKGLNFGPLQPIIDEALKSPKDPKATGPAILVENARLDLRTPGGLARITGDASLDDGQLLRFDGQLARMRYAVDDLVVEARGALVSARKRGDRLSVTARFDLDALVREDLELDDAQGEINADITYPDLVKLSADGPAEIRVAVTADAARYGTTRTEGLAADLALAGKLDGSAANGRFDGRLTGKARGDALDAPNLNARELGVNFDLAHLTLSRQNDRLAVRADGHVSADAERALAGGVALSGGSLRIDSAGLLLSSDKTGAFVSGPVAIQMGAGRLASGGLALTSLAANARGRVSGPLASPGLTLDGAAGADSGISGPDAERLTAALPNPAYARTAAQALRTFDLRVPALHVSVQNGRTILALAKPITMDAANGVTAQIAAPGGALLDVNGTAMRGGLSARLAGGGLPNLRLDAPDWRMEGGAFASRLALTADHLDIPPLEGIAGKIEGQARFAGARASFALSACTPFTAARALVGETPLSGPKAILCPAAAPLFTLNDGAWTAAARFRDLETSLDEAEARIGDVAGGLSASGSGSRMSAEVQLDQGVLSDAAETKRFNPIKTSGRLALSNGVWAGAIDATTPKNQPLGRITIRHDVAQARGRAELDASRLVFAKDGLQPVDLSPMAAFAKNAAGRASFTGLFVWDADGMTSKGRLVADKIDFHQPDRLRRHPGRRHRLRQPGPADQRARPDPEDHPHRQPGAAAGLRLGLHLGRRGAAHLVGRLRGRQGSGLDRAHRRAAGSAKADARRHRHRAPGPGRVDRRFVPGGKGAAGRRGRRPPAVRVRPQGLPLPGRQDRAIQPGRMAISREALTGVQAGVQGQDSDSPGAPAKPVEPQAPVNAIQDFAYQAMENLSFDTLEAGVNSTDQGRLAILFHIKGEHDPKVVEKARIGLIDLIRGTAFNKRIALPAKTPVELTLDTSLNFDELLAAWQNAYKAQSEAAQIDAEKRSDRFSRDRPRSNPNWRQTHEKARPTDGPDRDGSARRLHADDPRQGRPDQHLRQAGRRRPGAAGQGSPDADPAKPQPVLGKEPT